MLDEERRGAGLDSPRRPSLGRVVAGVVTGEEGSIDTQSAALFTEDIADGVRRRDPDAVTVVYEALADRLLGFLIARVGDRQTAEDLLESTFVELLERGDTIRGGASVIKAWLFRAAHFNALDLLRRRQRAREELVSDHDRYDGPDSARGPAEHALHADLSRELRAAMAQLSEDQQEVLLLRYVGGLTAPEAAAVLGKNVPAVRGLQHRGERSLARILEREGSGLAGDGADDARGPAPVEAATASQQQARTDASAIASPRRAGRREG